MAVSPNQQAAQIKLRELRRQRDRLDEHYSAVEGRAAAAGSPFERLQVLFEGLRQATFAGKPLHPEVANLDGLFLQGRSGVAPPDLVDAWLQRLQRELERGRLRAELAHAFGGVLAEIPAPAAPAPGDADLLGADTGDQTATFDLAFVDRLCDALGARALEAVVRDVRAFANSAARAAVTDDEVKAVLTLLKKDPTRPPELRRQAAAALDSATQLHEYTGVLTILLANLAEWDWPAEGFRRRVIPLRDKPRVFLDEDLLTALLLQVIGLRWGMALKPIRRDLLANAGASLWSAEGPRVVRSVLHHRATLADRLFLSMIPRTLQEMQVRGGYLGNDLEQQLRWVQAEIRFHQAAFPGLALHIVRTDLRDFYPRIPHAVLLRLLERIGVPDLWRDFLGRYLRVRVRLEDGVRSVQRGVPLDHLLGDILAELLLLLLDVHIERASGLWPIRMVDDIFLVSDDGEKARRAWQAIGAFCSGVGLEVNAGKSGAVTLDGPPEDGLPEGAVTWGALRLDDDAVWRLHEPMLEHMQGWTRRQVEAGGSMLGMVRAWNDAMRFLIGMLGLSVDLGPNHLLAVGDWLAQLQANLFGPGQGLAAFLHGRLSREVRDSRLQQRGLPEALLYWPVTAGGLGLVQPLLSVAAYARFAVEQSRPPVRPTAGNGNWLHTMEWSTFFQGLLPEIPPVSPTPTPAFAGLVQDFISRGTEVVGRRQVGLKPYWQWVLYTYGPPLLDALGTFRFLLTELVPLGLVFQRGEAEVEDVVDEGDAVPF